MSPRVSMPIVVQMCALDDSAPDGCTWSDVKTGFKRLAEAEKWVADEGEAGRTHRIVRISPDVLTPRVVTTRSLNRTTVIEPDPEPPKPKEAPKPKLVEAPAVPPAGVAPGPDDEADFSGGAA